MERNELILELEKSLPAVFAELAVPELIPGIMSHRTLKNLRCKGKGPRCFKVGRRILYRKTDFLDWLSQRLSDEE